MHSRQASRLKIEWWQKRLLLIKKINGKNRMDLTSRDPCSRDVTVTNCPLRSPQAWHWECRLRIFDSSPAAQDGERCPGWGKKRKGLYCGPGKQITQNYFLLISLVECPCVATGKKNWYTLCRSHLAPLYHKQPTFMTCTKKRLVL